MHDLGTAPDSVKCLVLTTHMLPPRPPGIVVVCVYMPTSMPKDDAAPAFSGLGFFADPMANGYWAGPT